MGENQLCIIATFCSITTRQAQKFHPTVVLVDGNNSITKVVNDSGGYE